MPIKRVQSDDRVLSLIQDNMGQAILPSDNSPFVGGSFFTSLVLASGANTFVHGLGRLPKIWIICDLDAGVTIYRTAWTTNDITLHSSGAATISLWVN